jgi:hypothetical protein
MGLYSRIMDKLYRFTVTSVKAAVFLNLKTKFLNEKKSEA